MKKQGETMSNQNGDLSQEEQQYWMKMGTMISESCLAKSVLSGVAGYGLGLMFGLFMNSFHTPGVEQAASMTVRGVLKDMKLSSLRSARQFGSVGLLFAGAECLMESMRGRKDTITTLSSGCLTGAYLGKETPTSAVIGCGGFALFSLAIDHFMEDKI
eukprot:NODE_165_length_16345_cov_0.329743.p7 type:complete len:158 gc:universal NODE_165_length_16345_cov_0.329743:9515-9042(-)